MQEATLENHADLGSYKKYYRPNGDNKLFLSFNICALLFGPLWYFYRKMFAIGIGIYSLSLLIGFAFHLTPLTPAYINDTHLWLIDCGMFALFSLLANWLYMRHLSKLSNKNVEKLTSFKSLLAGFLISLLLLIPWVYGMVKLLPYKQKQLMSIIEKDTPHSIALYKHMFSKKHLSINAQNEKGESLVYIAVHKNFIHQLTFLAKAGADLDLPNHNGVTPVQLAAFKGNSEVVKLLLEHGAKMQSSRSRYTPLMAAAYAGHIEIVKFLVEKGADVTFGDKSMGETAIQVARAQKQTEIADYLLKHGAMLQS